MALQSQLFRDDPKLEAAAVSDAAHIVLGAKGEHVRKIQLALIQLDGATIDADSSYGPATAAAVLAYKQKRNIVNPAYQTQPDNIVGKMTMASLDSEMLEHESRPRTDVQIKPLSYWTVRPARSPALVALMDSSRPLELNFAIDSAAVGEPRIIPGPPNSSNVVLEMRRNSMGSFVVLNGAPLAEVVIEDPTIAKITDPATSVTPSNKAWATTNRHLFSIFSARTLGRTTLTVTTILGSTASIDVVVKTFFEPPTFVKGVNHAHKPAGRWADIQANPNNAPGFIGRDLATRCKESKTPKEFVDNVMKKSFVFADKPIATKHVNWYLTDGKGADFIEDNNIKNWLTLDFGIQRRLKREIFPHGKKPRGEGHFFFSSADYNESNEDSQDFRFAFGSIDRVDFEVDFSQDTVRVWFQDRYEWHPVYPFYTFLPGDTVRPTNCLHAAFVEMKSEGAADFWMKGQAEVALSRIALPLTI